MKKILVTYDLNDNHKNKIENSFKGAEFVYKKRLTFDDVSDINVILGNVPVKFLLAAPKLEWVQLNSAGADAYIKSEIEQKNFTLTNATGAYGLAISEYLIAGTLNLMKRLNQYQVKQLAHEWAELGEVTSIEGSRALIVGLGDIGGDFGKKMKALGSTVVGIKRTTSEKPEWLDELYTLENLDEELSKADIVALALPSTPQTVGLINLDKLKLMKSNSILLNVGRGTAIVTDDLIMALNDGIIFGAFLDVTDPEPLPKDHPLWDAKNVIITPHITGQYHLPETFERVINITCENLSRFSKNEKLINIVNFKTGYSEKS